MGKVPQIFISNYVVITIYFVKNSSFLTGEFHLHTERVGVRERKPLRSKEGSRVPFSLGTFLGMKPVGRVSYALEHPNQVLRGLPGDPSPLGQTKKQRRLLCGSAPLQPRPSLLQHPHQLRQELQFVISARSLLGLTDAGMCLLSLATVGLSSVLSILKLLYLSIQEVLTSQLRWESFELRGSEYTER